MALGTWNLSTGRVDTTTNRTGVQYNTYLEQKIPPNTIGPKQTA
jgi:hypothetical protein